MFLDTKSIAERLTRELKEKLDSMPEQRVAFVSLKDDPAAKSFLRRKTEVALKLGVDTEVLHQVPSTLEGYSGVVIQLPLPENLNKEEVLNSISLELDIDMLGDEAKNSFARKVTNRVPPVAFAVWEIIKVSGVNLEGKKLLVLGKGRLVGAPVCQMFENLNIDFHVVDEFTPEEGVLELLQSADVVVSGVGKPHLVKPEMVKGGALLIDAGTSAEEGKLKGDIDPACAQNCLVTPVPGGVGPIAVLGLFRNLTETPNSSV